MDIYKEWNFKDNPFQTTSLPPLPIGNQLLAGREDEIKKLLRRLYNQPQLVTIEGLNGIGKSSLINVAIFRAVEEYLIDKESRPLFIPCDTVFQLDPQVDADQFMDEVFVAIAQTLIKYAKDIKSLNISLPQNMEEIDKWLNSSVYYNYQGSVGPIGFGKSLEPNVSTGFERSGFRNIVLEWLKLVFPQKHSGGVVCVIDNMELLTHSQTARMVVESLRDTLFTIHGIRWVLCGSLGIIMIDEADIQRKTIQITPKGWFVSHAIGAHQ